MQYCGCMHCGSRGSSHGDGGNTVAQDLMLLLTDGRIFGILPVIACALHVPHYTHLGYVNVSIKTHRKTQDTLPH